MASKSLYTIDNGKLSLHFHHGQSKAWSSLKRFVFVIAGTQGGKTSFGPWWLWREVMNRGTGDYFAVAPSYDMFKLKMLPEMRNVFEHLLGIGRYWAGDGVIEICDPITRKFTAKRSDDPMWARIILRSASAEGGLESATAKGAWLDEVGQDDFDVDAWEAIVRRVSLNTGRILGTTTPYNLGWLKQLVYEPWIMGDPDFDVIQFSSTANPLFPEAELKRAEATLPSWKFKMFYLGQFERPAGMIYQDFIDKYEDVGGHLVKPFSIPNTWPVYVGVDPGSANLAIVWLAHDSIMNNYYVFREEHGERRSTMEHVRHVQSLAKAHNERIIAHFVGAKSESQQRMDWSSAGAKNVREPITHDVESGIDRIIRLLREHRLFVFDNCKGIISEFGSYSRIVDKNGNTTDEIKDKAKYHRLDALRYGASGTHKVGVGFA